METVITRVLRALGLARPGLPGPLLADPDEAEEFVRAHFAEEPGSYDVEARVRSIRGEIAATGTYVHTPRELAWAAKAAWRHSARCNGRDKWRTLRVRDRRWASAAADVFEQTMEHLELATNGGRVRSYVTIFAPDTPHRPGPRILNSQVLRYAGYPDTAGTFLGDPGNAELTALAARLGWKGGRTAFDILPLVIRDGSGRLRMFDIPPGLVLEVPIVHPEFTWFAGLGLKWYAVPLISDMYLDAGGVRYPCAPFNGWYQAGTEVGVRNLGDAARYDMLPAVAAGMGLDTSRLSTLWRDRAVVELAVAVQHSFRAAGVMATDHQSEAVRFMRFIEAEEEAGRPWCADWAWVNPPISASTTPCFHRTYPDVPLRPAYIRHEQDAHSR